MGCDQQRVTCNLSHEINMENTRKHNMEWSGSVTENEVQIPQN